MSRLQVGSEEQQPKGKRFTWLFWVAFGVIITITLLLSVLVFWIIKTQDFTKASSIISLIASIVGILSGPLILLFTITKWPEKQPVEPYHLYTTEYVLKPVKDLDPNDYIFPYIKDVYLRRQDARSAVNIDAIAQEELHKIAFQTVTPPRRPLGICIFGRPTQGKTRLAWETICSMLPTWTLVKWTHEQQHTFDFAAQHGQNLILWLDDLHEFASPNEANELEDLPRQFHEAGVSLIIVATCRDGDSETQTKLYLEKLLERLVEIRLTDISPKEADQFTAELNQHGIPAKRSQFDGTPGSLLLGVDRMRNQRYPALSKPAKQVLKAMKLLHSVNINDYFASRVSTTAVELFGLNEQDWRDACDILARESFIKLGSNAVDNSRTLIPVAEVYLEQAVPDYPPPTADITDDWPHLLETFVQLQDAFALNRLGIAFLNRDHSFGMALTNYQYAEKCFRAALAIYKHNSNPIDSAITQSILADTFMDQANRVSGAQKVSLLQQAADVIIDALIIVGSAQKTTPYVWATVHRVIARLMRDSAEIIEVDKQLKLLHDSAKYYDHALESSPQESDPDRWAILQHELGIVLSMQVELTESPTVQSDLIQRAIEAFHAALVVITKEMDPTGWASIQNSLGNVLSRQAEISEETKRGELLEQAIEAYYAALGIRNEENNLEGNIVTQVNLGNTLRMQAELVKGDKQQRLLRESVTIYRNLLATCIPEAPPSTIASIQYNLALSLTKLADLAERADRLNLFQQAGAAYRVALSIYTREYTPNKWAMAQNNLGGILSEQAELVETTEQKRDLYQQMFKAYQAALEVYTQESTPNQWAKIQNNIGAAYQKLANLVEGNDRLDLLEQAVAACHAAQSARIREYVPFEWAMTEQSLGNILNEQAMFTNDRIRQRDLLQQATQAYQSSLEVYTYVHDPDTWAMIQNELGDTFFRLLDISEEVEKPSLLQSALIAYQAVLHVYTQGYHPDRWALAQTNLGAIMHGLARYASDPAKTLGLLQQAVTAFKKALLFFTQEGYPKSWSTTQIRLANALCELMWYVDPMESPNVLQQGIASFNAALLVFTPANNLNSWEEAHFKLALLHATIPTFEENKTARCNALNRASFYIEQLLSVIDKETDRAQDALRLSETINSMKQEYCSDN
jgi:tetratricopeptide (TPR) repeat protein